MDLATRNLSGELCGLGLVWASSPLTWGCCSCGCGSKSTAQGMAFFIALVVSVLGKGAGPHCREAPWGVLGQGPQDDSAVPLTLVSSLKWPLQFLLWPFSKNLTNTSSFLNLTCSKAKSTQMKRPGSVHFLLLVPHMNEGYRCKKVGQSYFIHCFDAESWQILKVKSVRGGDPNPSQEAFEWLEKSLH